MKKLILSLSVVGILSSPLFAGDTAEQLIAKNDCMSCHNIMGMKAAPSFADIAWRNSRLGADAKNTLKNSIKNGSHGKYPMFSNTKMPSFSKLNDSELDTLATWVLSQSSNMDKCGMSNGMGNGMGKCGMGNGMGKCGGSMNNSNSTKGW
jgi:cytochrome c